MLIYAIYKNCKIAVYHLITMLSNIIYYKCDFIDIKINDNIITSEEFMHILGKKYEYNFELLKKQTNQIQHFTYRENFSPLKNTMTNDIGWGCMARTGQMMLCFALQKRFNKTNNDIIHYFYDLPTSPFSIHNITTCGENHHIKIGNWFNPTGIGYTLKELVAICPETQNELEIIIGRDSCVCRLEITNVLDNNKKVLLLIPVMLGIEKINNAYCSELLKCFEIKSNIGVVGGKPRQSFYFIGKQQDHVFFLDPHIIRPALKSYDQYINENNNYYNDNDEIIRYTDVSNLDPCMLLCFLITSYEDLYDLQNANSSLFLMIDKHEEINDTMEFDSDKNFKGQTTDNSDYDIF